MTALGEGPQGEGGAGAGVDDPQAFILSRARSEVHLLLDNLSANPDVNFAALAATSSPASVGLPEDWIKQVCEITWPPETGRGSVGLSDQAALLIRTKDYLNGLAKPASGASIAFTLMVTQGEGSRARARRAREQVEGSPSRASLAAEAYPDLFDKAQSFRRFIGVILWGSIAAFVVTVLVSWYLAIGNAALADYATTHAALGEADGRVNVAQAALEGDPEASPPGQSDQAAAPRRPTGAVGSPQGGQASATALPAPAATYLLHPCLPDTPTTAYASAELRNACFARKLEANRYLAVRAGLASWSLGITDPDTARWWANMLGSGLLPVLYGFLGAIVAAVRTLFQKIRRSLLSPRDLHLTLQQLALGTIVGACISLFITVPGQGDHGAESLLGPVALSGSAIAFVAGFGVDSVFQALDALIRRIFNAAPAGAETTAAGPAVPAQRDTRNG